MANESQLRPSEIKDVLLSEIENYEEELHAEEVGEVLEVKDGVARLFCFDRCCTHGQSQDQSRSVFYQPHAICLHTERRASYPDHIPATDNRATC